MCNGGTHYTNVSIHAPTWGATRRDYPSRLNEQVSIHAPTWGATLDNAFHNAFAIVSIHAPTWGATGLLCSTTPLVWFQSTLPRGERRVIDSIRLMSLCFNPRSHVGSDPAATSGHRPDASFNPRSHVGSDCQPIKPETPAASFNPRSHVGSDVTALKFYPVRRVSIHAPTWGATEIHEYLERKEEVSIHAPTWGATVRP